MSDPATSLSVKGHCTVIHDGVLYVYSPSGMQALPLRDGGEWTDLPMGVSVEGGVCVSAPSKDMSKASMYIVGGVANSSMADYPGLQQYHFTQKKWETITPLVPVTKNRRNHAAAFLRDSETIIVYAGSQNADSPELSSQTFLLSLSEPYATTAFNAEAPPLTMPQLMPWNDSHALMAGGGIGGDADNMDLYTFDPDNGWADLGTSLQKGIPDSSVVRCSVVTGEDGSKVLQTFDTSVSPNAVQAIVLWKAPGEPAAPGTMAGNSSSSSGSDSNSNSRKRKRDLTLDNWPAYNDTLAPTTKRSGFALATDEEGLAVLSGGGSDAAFAVFNQQKNTWVNATQLLGSQEPLVVSSITSSASMTSTSATSAASITPPSSSPATTAPASGGASQPQGDNSHTYAVIGATLGAIFGAAFLLLVILLLLRMRKNRKRRQQGGYLNEKDQDRMSFADQGTEFMHTAGGSVGHKYTASMNNSLTSLNIIAGKTQNSKSGKAHTRNGGSAGSDSSTTALVKKSPLGFSDSVEMSQMRPDKSPNASASPKLINVGQKNRAPPAALTDPPPLTAGAIRAARGQAAQSSRPISRGNDIRPGSSGSASRGGAIVAGMGGAGGGQNSRSSGWSRYFANNENPTSLGGAGYGAARKKSTDSSASKSQYTRDSVATSSNVTYPSQTVQPLELNLGPKFDSSLADGQRLSRVATGSPTFAHSRDHSTNGRDPGTSGLTAELSRTTSGKSTNNSTIGDLTYGSTNTADGVFTATTWTPVSDRGFAGAANHGNHGSVGSSIYSRNPQSYYPAYDDRRNLYHKSNASGAPTLWPVPPKSSHGEDNRDSTVTVFPRGVPASPGLPPMPTTVNGQKQYGYGQGLTPAKKTPVGEDVSWLNLGGNAGAAY